MKKEYTNGEVTILWQPEKCIHSGKCVMGNAKVFNPRRKPWIEMEHSNTEEITRIVHNCPSGAISLK